jgi:hypothetical protein
MPQSHSFGIAIGENNMKAIQPNKNMEWLGIVSLLKIEHPRGPHTSRKSAEPNHTLSTAVLSAMQLSI